MSAAKGKGLGKGLGALFDDMEINVPARPQEEAKTGRRKKAAEDESDIVYLDIHEIRPNEDQPRKHFDESAIDELAASIEIHGVIQPIMVRPSTAGYELVAGERRWRAARKAGLKTIPGIVRRISEEQRVFFALIENMQREDLNPLEEAEAIAKIIDTCGLTQEEVSKNVGKSRPYITNALRLLKLPEEVREMVADGTLSGGHGKAIAAIKDPEKQVLLAKHVAKTGCSVREAEALAADERFGMPVRKAKPRPKNHEVTSLEEELQRLLGTKVSINNNGKKGKVEIHYYSHDELEGILEQLRTLG